MNKLVLAMVLAGAIGVGVYLYSRRASASGPVDPGVPDRVAKKRQVGAAIASSSDSYRPQLPPEFQAAADTAAIAVKRGSDLVNQGRNTAAAAQRGDVAGTLRGAADLYSGAASAASAFGGSRDAPQAVTTPKLVAPTTMQRQLAAAQAFKPGLAPTTQQRQEIAANAQVRSGKNRF